MTDPSDHETTKTDPDPGPQPGAGEAGATPAEQLDAEALVKTEAAMLRALADRDNIRKRAERDVANARKFGTEALIKDLLPVLDSLDRALEADPDTPTETWREGTALTRKLLAETLNRHGITELSPLGERFDPEHHEALRVVALDQVKPNTVVAVLDKGYLLNGRLIRPAKVAVSGQTQQATDDNASV